MHNNNPGIHRFLSPFTSHPPQPLRCCWQPRKGWDSESHAIHEGVSQVASFHPDYRFADA
jgi:hypothetical protein